MTGLIFWNGKNHCKTVTHVLLSPSSILRKQCSLPPEVKFKILIGKENFQHSTGQCLKNGALLPGTWTEGGNDKRIPPRCLPRLAWPLVRDGHSLAPAISFVWDWVSCSHSGPWVCYTDQGLWYPCLCFPSVVLQAGATMLGFMQCWGSNHE